MNLRIIEAHLRKQNGLPDDFHFYHWECFPHGRQITLYIELTGCRCPLKTRGEWKGRPNFKKRERGSDQKFTVLTSEIEQIESDYEQETGKCRQCEGVGKTVASFGISGTTYRECSRCKGTGVPKQLEQVVS